MFLDAPDVDQDFEGGGLMPMASAPASTGRAHLGAAGVFLLLIGLKAFTESNLFSANPQEIKVSVVNILGIWLMWKAGDIGVTMLTSAMAARGVTLPGQRELVGA